MTEQSRLALRNRLHLQVDLCHDAQCAQRPDVKLHQVVAGDVLHHFSAGARDLARWVRDRDPDYPITHGPIARAAKPVGIGRDHPADGRPLRVRRIQREPLPLRAQRRLQVRKSHPGLDAAGEVGGLVFEQPRHPFGRKGDVVATWWSAEPHLGATAPDHHRRRCEVAQPQPAPRVLRVARMHDLRRQQVVHAQTALLVDRDLVPGQDRGAGSHTHRSSPPATACRRE